MGSRTVIFLIIFDSGFLFLVFGDHGKLEKKKERKKETIVARLPISENLVLGETRSYD